MKRSRPKVVPKQQYTAACRSAFADGLGAFTHSPSFPAPSGMDIEELSSTPIS